MIKSLKVFLLPVLALIVIFMACNKAEDALATTEEAIDQALYSAQERGGLGRRGCYELVFPVSIVLPDSSIVEVNSYDEVKAALRAYFEANGTGPGNGHHHHGAGHRPHLAFVFPISVVSQDGEVITVDADTDLRALRAACAGTFGNHGPAGHGNHGLSCFEIVFPVTVLFPDGTTATATDRHALRMMTRRWHNENPGAPGRPQITFPLTVKMTEDSTLVTVNSRDELRALKESCE